MFKCASIDISQFRSIDHQNGGAQQIKERNNREKSDKIPLDGINASEVTYRVVENVGAYFKNSLGVGWMLASGNTDR